MTYNKQKYLIVCPIHEAIKVKYRTELDLTDLNTSVLDKEPFIKDVWNNSIYHEIWGWFYLIKNDEHTTFPINIPHNLILEDVNTK